MLSSTVNQLLFGRGVRSWRVALDSFLSLPRLSYRINANLGHHKAKHVFVVSFGSARYGGAAVAESEANHSQ
jgi:hypothetical protein